MILTLLAPNIPAFTGHGDLGRTLAVDLCIYIHQLLDDSCMMTFRVVTIQIPGEGQLGSLSLLLVELAGVILVDS